MKKSAFRYQISFVDTATDTVAAVRRTYDMEGVKRQIARYIAPAKKYDNTGAIVIYVLDEDFWTAEGRYKLDKARKHAWIDNDAIFERGIDFDIWHDHYLTTEERKMYNLLRVH